MDKWYLELWVDGDKLEGPANKQYNNFPSNNTVKNGISSMVKAVKILRRTNTNIRDANSIEVKLRGPGGVYKTVDIRGQIGEYNEGITVHTVFYKMKSLNDVYNRLKSVSLSEASLSSEKSIYDLKKLFDKYQHTKLSRDKKQNLVLTVEGSYDYGEYQEGVVVVFTPNDDGTFNVIERMRGSDEKTRNGLSLDNIKQLYGGPGGLIGESISLNEQNRVVNKILVRPMSDVKVKEVFVDGNVYRWNPVYRTYNSVKGNELLYTDDVERIDWNKSR